MITEPLFNLAKAKITLTPCMTLEDIRKGVEEATRRMSSMEGWALGDSASFVTVRWNAKDERGNVMRDTGPTYHLLATPEGWRFLSYTNHFSRRKFSPECPSLCFLVPGRILPACAWSWREMPQAI